MAHCLLRMSQLRASSALGMLTRKAVKCPTVLLTVGAMDGNVLVRVLAPVAARSLDDLRDGPPAREGLGHQLQCCKPDTHPSDVQTSTSPAMAASRSTLTITL